MYSVKVLGVGNLSDPLANNTSFLLYRNGIVILIDCGYNIFPYLLTNHKNDLENINQIFITHNHPDHIGSLGQLIYYRFFYYGLKTVIITGPNNIAPLKSILSKMVPNVTDYSEPKIKFDVNCWEITSDFYYSLQDYFEVNHCGMPAYGYCDNFDKCFVVTGDTDILNPNSNIFKRANIIFHDCSLGENKFPNVHANINDIIHYYPEDILFKLILVHHGVTAPNIYELQNKYKCKFATSEQTFYI